MLLGTCSACTGSMCSCSNWAIFGNLAHKQCSLCSSWAVVACLFAGNRLAEESTNPKALALGGLCSHLKGLTGLTHLHISSNLEYSKGVKAASLVQCLHRCLCMMRSCRPAMAD